MRIGMVSTRFAGLDGVTLEAAKVADILEAGGHEVVWCAGELGPGFSQGMTVPEAHFDTVANVALESRLFNGGDSGACETEIQESSARIRTALDRFVDDFTPDVLVVQNAWAIPMQFPLAGALVGLVEDRRLPAVGHHHDFAWERARFSECAVGELLESWFPPAASLVSHMVINSDAKDALATRRALTSTVLPNVMDFEHGDSSHDGGATFRAAAGLGDDDIVLLQPTRVIRRKGIERTIDLAGRLSIDAKVVVTHPDDRDPSYWAELEALARDLGVDLRLVDAGRSRDSLASAYGAANLVCFPSLYEGFGNALVEAMFYRRPLFVNRYPVYKRDIAPLGVRAVEIEGPVTPDTVDAVEALLSDPRRGDADVDANFDVGMESLSYERAGRIIDERIAAAVGGAGT